MLESVQTACRHLLLMDLPKRWKLNRYGRYEKSATKGKGPTLDSVIEDDSEAEMFLTITQSKCLVITLGTRVLESHSLVTARPWMRGICKTDSLLFLYRILNETRRFRVRFSGTEGMSGTEVCLHCKGALSAFFTIQTAEEAHHLKQRVSNSTNTSTDMAAAVDEASSSPPTPGLRLEGEVTLSTMAAVVSGQLKAELPSAYHQCDVPQDALSTILQLCLSDATFPAFVDRIERELLAIIGTETS